MTVLRDLEVSIDFSDIDIRALTNVQNTMDNIETILTQMGARLNSTTNRVNQLGQRAGQAGQNGQNGMNGLRRSTQQAGNAASSSTSQFNILGSTIGKLTGLIGGFLAVSTLKDKATEAIELAAAVRATESQFEQVFGNFSGTAERALERFEQNTSIMSERVKGSYIQMTAFAKTTGADTGSALKLADRAMRAAADSAAFYDKSIESSTESLQSFLKGNFENDAALGISATETTRNAAANKLYGKSFKDLSESQKQLTLLQMVEDGNKLSGALGQASREGDGFENVMGNMKASADKLKATLGEKLLDPAIDGIKWLTKAIGEFDSAKIELFLENAIQKAREMKPAVMDTLENAKTGMQYLGGAIKLVKDNFVPLIAVTAGYITAMKSFVIISTATKSMQTMIALFKAWRAGTLLATAAQMGFNTALLTSPITWFAVGLGVLVAAGILVWKNFDVIKEKAKGLFDMIKKFKVPEWLKTLGGGIAGAAKGVKNLVMGSHATGLEKVPFDGYTAELHKDEAVLTARQSDALRKAGILSSDSSGKPQLDMNNQTQMAATNKGGGGGTSVGPISVSVHVTQNSNEDNGSFAQRVAEETKRQMEALFRQLNVQMG